jgi:tungstate transport system ATP-binding protein
MLDVAAKSQSQAGAGKERGGILPVETRELVFEAGGKRLIDEVDLTIGAGPITVLMGPNGAGKSLLLRLLHGLILPTSGAVLWRGKPISNEIRKRQAMVFQQPVLLRRSVAANIDFVLRSRDGEIGPRRDELLEMGALRHLASSPARKLSGGEQQRLALVRALALDPDVLFLDEPTASLDPASVSAIEGLVKEADARGTKVIFVTHAFGQAKRLADEVIFVDRGRILEQGPADQFFDDPQTSEARDYLAGRIVM